MNAEMTWTSHDSNTKSPPALARVALHIEIQHSNSSLNKYSRQTSHLLPSQPSPSICVMNTTSVRFPVMLLAASGWVDEGISERRICSNIVELSIQMHHHTLLRNELLNGHVHDLIVVPSFTSLHCDTTSGLMSSATSGANPNFFHSVKVAT